MKFRYVIICLLVLASVLTASAVERQLARVRLGMKPKDVIDLLGEPTAILMAQPPLTGGAPAAQRPGMGGPGMGVPGMGGPGMGGPGMGGPGMGEAAGPAQAENTLIFLYNDQEIVLDGNTKISTGSNVGPGTIPFWAYTVRVARLALDQQELIYRINDTYSLGITITGQGNEARVTDAIACSLKPLTYWPSDPTRGYNRANAFFADMFFFKYADKDAQVAKNKRDLYLTAGTSKGITIGSRLNDVLLAHKWPSYFIPFTTEAAAVVTFDSKGVKVSEAQGGKSGGGTANFATGPTGSLSAGFANNCLLFYPDDGLALTLMNFTVVRIQIGKELSKPGMEEFVPDRAGAPAGGLRPQ
ncbi:MAG: hypothetical protein ACYDCO_11870 [Armatimonadota bacterium]